MSKRVVASDYLNRKPSENFGLGAEIEVFGVMSVVCGGQGSSICAKFRLELLIYATSDHPNEIMWVTTPAHSSLTQEGG